MQALCSLNWRVGPCNAADLEDWDRVMIVNARGPSYATIVIHHAETYTLNVSFAKHVREHVTLT